MKTQNFIISIIILFISCFIFINADCPDWPYTLNDAKNGYAGDFLFLTLQWAGSRTGNPNVNGVDDDFTIHGVWPQCGKLDNGQPQWPEDCYPPAHPYQARDLDGLSDNEYSSLMSYWPTFINANPGQRNFDDPQLNFWNHEYSKHGTCLPKTNRISAIKSTQDKIIRSKGGKSPGRGGQDSIISFLDYLRLGDNLRKKENWKSAFGFRNDRVPLHGSATSVRSFSQNMRGITGHSPSFRCINGRIDEVYICFKPKDRLNNDNTDANNWDFIDCPQAVIANTQSCGDVEIIVPSTRDIAGLQNKYFQYIRLFNAPVVVAAGSYYSLRPLAVRPRTFYTLTSSVVANFQQSDLINLPFFRISEQPSTLIGSQLFIDAARAGNRCPNLRTTSYRLWELRLQGDVHTAEASPIFSGYMGNVNLFDIDAVIGVAPLGGPGPGIALANNLRYRVDNGWTYVDSWYDTDETDELNQMIVINRNAPFNHADRPQTNQNPYKMRVVDTKPFIEDTPYEVFNKQNKICQIRVEIAPNGWVAPPAQPPRAHPVSDPARTIKVLYRSGRCDINDGFAEQITTFVGIKDLTFFYQECHSTNNFQPILRKTCESGIPPQCYP